MWKSNFERKSTDQYLESHDHISMYSFLLEIREDTTRGSIAGLALKPRNYKNDHPGTVEKK